MTSCIHFIRHGITEGIINKWFYGEADLPLIEEGLMELNKFKKENIYPPLEGASCYTSGMLRANQTFEAIYPGSQYKVIKNLREMSFGRWECKTFDQLKTLEGFDMWINDKSGTFTFPGGESPVGFYNRVERGLNELLEEHEKQKSVKGCSSSIVVCHGGVIGVCMCLLTGKASEKFWEWIPGPGRGYTVFLENGKAVEYANL